MPSVNLKEAVSLPVVVLFEASAILKSVELLFIER